MNAELLIGRVEDDCSVRGKRVEAWLIPIKLLSEQLTGLNASPHN